MTEENMSFTPFMYTAFRVSNVDKAIACYQKFGFKNTCWVPGNSNDPLICFIQYGAHTLILARLKGLPYPLTLREKAIKQGPRGLGTKISFNVEDLDLAYQLCKNEQCELTMEPTEELWGDRRRFIWVFNFCVFPSNCAICKSIQACSWGRNNTKQEILWLIHRQSA